MLRSSLTLLAAAAGLAACAHQPADTVATTVWVSPPATPVTRFADADRDGKVTRKEARVDPGLAKSFDKYDRNDDDILDRGEFAQLEADNRRQAPGTQMTVMEPRTGARRDADRPMTLNRTGVDQLRPETE